MGVDELAVLGTSGAVSAAGRGDAEERERRAALQAAAENASGPCPVCTRVLVLRDAQAEPETALRARQWAFQQLLGSGGMS